MYSKEFGELNGMLWEKFGDKDAHEITEKIAKLERKINYDSKKLRDKVRDFIDEIRKEYRPIRSQVDKISDKCTALGKWLRTDIK